MLALHALLLAALRLRTAGGVQLVTSVLKYIPLVVIGLMGFIYLRPAATGKRIGTKLMQALLDAGKAAGVKEVVAVISDRGAESSIALHNSFGFTTQGQLGKVGFKFGRWLGTILMQKSL
mgnify:CR=1 FL=1